jgi:hypothetical protein
MNVLAAWYEKIGAQFDCSDRQEKEKVLDVLLERRDMSEYALVYRERELRTVRLVELKSCIVQGWKLYKHKHNDARVKLAATGEVTAKSNVVFEPVAVDYLPARANWC